MSGTSDNLVVRRMHCKLLCYMYIYWCVDIMCSNRPMASPFVRYVILMHEHHIACLDQSSDSSTGDVHIEFEASFQIESLALTRQSQRFSNLLLAIMGGLGLGNILLSLLLFLVIFQCL